MIDRTMAKRLIQLSELYPVVTVMGPRQSGKTMLVRTTFPKMHYVNLEHPVTRANALADPDGFLTQYPQGMILDEIQNLPEFLSFIMVIVDEEKRCGQYILTSSHHLMLHKAVTQSLAGRTGILKLLPLSLAELSGAGINAHVHDSIVNGGFPRLYEAKHNPQTIYADYFEMYIERDLRQLITLRNPSRFVQFAKLLAGRIGQLLNLSSLSMEVGVSVNTLKAWLSMLEASFIVTLLQPYHENFGKRLVKTPKLYFIDVGLASYLLNIETPDQLARDPLRGQLFENLVVMELMKARYHIGRRPNMYFWRDRTGHEVDVVYKTGHELIPIEIKMSETFQLRQLKNLSFFDRLVGDRSPRQYVIFRGQESQPIDKIQPVNYSHSAQVILSDFA